MTKLKININAPNLVSICVDGRNSSEIYGRMYTKLSSDATPFTGSSSLLMRMEDYFDQINFPQASTLPRSFSKNEVNKTREVVGTMSRNDITLQKGEKGTFIVHVQYRQNATWQGNVVWAEKNINQNFRSALELLKLIDSALDESGVD